MLGSGLYPYLQPHIHIYSVSCLTYSVFGDANIKSTCRPKDFFHLKCFILLEHLLDEGARDTRPQMLCCRGSRGQPSLSRLSY